MKIFGLKTHILCLLTGVVHQDCIQHTAVIVVAHINGWSYLSDYELLLSEVCLGGARKGENEYNLIKRYIVLPELYEYFDLLIFYKKYLNSIMH